MGARKSIRRGISRNQAGPRKLPGREAILEYGGVREARKAFDRLVCAGVAPEEIVYSVQRVAWWYRPERAAIFCEFRPEIPDYTIKRLSKYLKNWAATIAPLISYPAGDLRGNAALSAGYIQDFARLPER